MAGRHDIFQYFNGEADVWGDPWAVRCKLAQALGGDLPAIVEQFNDRENEARALAAAEKLVAAARVAFGMKPFDPETGEGATHGHCVEAYRAFVEFCEAKKH